MSVGQMAFDQICLSATMVFNKISYGQIAFDQMSVGQIVFDQMVVGQMLFDPKT
jgi:hypothetical protein